MTGMEMTATFHMQPSTKKAVGAGAKHNEHSEETEHENDQLVKEDHELNRHVELASLDEVLHAQYDDYLKQRNDKLADDCYNGKISQEQYSTRSQSLNEYLAGSNGTKPKKAFTEAVATIGSLDIQKNLLDKLGFDYRMITVGSKEKGDQHQRPQLTDPIQRKQWTTLWANAYFRTAQMINSVGRGLTVVSVDLHSDEGGQPHAHLTMVNRGITEKGKPSTTMNSAVKSFLDGKATSNSKVNLRKFREVVDAQLMHDFNLSAKNMGFDVRGELIRTHSKGGRDMPEYQSNKQQEDELKDLLEQNKESEAMLRARTSRSKGKLNRRKVALDKREDDLEKREAELDKRENSIDSKQQSFDDDVKDMATTMGFDLSNKQHGSAWQRVKRRMRDIKRTIMRKVLNERKQSINQEKFDIKNEIEKYPEDEKAILHEHSGDIKIKVEKHKDDGPDL